MAIRTPEEIDAARRQAARRQTRVDIAVIAIGALITIGVLALVLL